MKRKNLYLMCGTPGSGKSTWVLHQMQMTDKKCVHVSRDKIRFSLLKDGEDYFSHEDEVVSIFIDTINAEIAGDAYAIFVDATHLTPKARNAVLDKLNLENVDIYPVNFNLPVEACLANNENRKGTLAYVPRGVIRRMHSQYIVPTDNEKYPYKSILTVGC